MNDRKWMVFNFLSFNEKRCMFWANHHKPGSQNGSLQLSCRAFFKFSSVQFLDVILKTNNDTTNKTIQLKNEKEQGEEKNDFKQKQLLKNVYREQERKII